VKIFLKIGPSEKRIACGGISKKSSPLKPFSQMK
jgi:hypothetical protein